MSRGWLITCAASAMLPVVAMAATDVWLARVSPALTSAERKLYQGFNETERESFRQVFWNDKAVTEAQYMERSAYVDGLFGSGREGSGANTDQGRIYLANGAPNAVHRLPASRTFVPCEVWYYDSLPQTGYRSRVQFLFYRRAGIGDFRLYSPTLNSIRDLLVPQPATRAMFPVNDIITANDIRNRLKYTPAEEEIVDASTSVARGITGNENADILSRAVSVSYMIHGEAAALSPRVDSRLVAVAPPNVRVLQFWAAGLPVVDIQVRLQAASEVGLTVEEHGSALEKSRIPLGYDRTRPVLYTQRFFLLPGRYQLWIDADGTRTGHPFTVNIQEIQALTGEALEEIPGEMKLTITPDPRSAGAAEIIARQMRGRAAR